MSNSRKQLKAIKSINKISQEADMFVFMLVDEDLALIDGGDTLTEDEKAEVWDTMNGRISDAYYEMLEQAVQDVLENRDS